MNTIADCQPTTRSLNRVAAVLVVGVVVASALAQSAAVPQTQPQAASAPVKQIDVSVDDRVELLSIIFHLAGNPEYCNPRVGSYAKDVAEHFGAFKDHAAIQTARRLRANRGVSYDAPMSLAAHLSDAAGMELLVPLDPWPEGLDDRWKPSELEEFLAQARQFAADSHFPAFFAAHKELYATSVARMEKVLAEQAHLEWFDEFFGPRRGGRFHVVLGMLNGPSCYGSRLARPDSTEMYCILGVWMVDAKGTPYFDQSVLSTVVHEFAHSYVNPVVDKWLAQLEAAGKPLFAKQEARMRRMAYGNWETMMRESMVRASVIRYTNRYQGSFRAAMAAMGEAGRGFGWMGELVKVMAEYEADRETYPTLDDFMPRVVEFFNAYAAKLAAKTQPGS